MSVLINIFTNILFSIKWRLHTENILTRIFTFAKNVNWSLIKESISNTTYITGTISYFIFIMFNAKIYTPICLFSFLLVTKCFFLRGSISRYLNELVFPRNLVKCISYFSLRQFNLLCVILQISSTNDCMPLILLTSPISPNCHHIRQEKINP